MGTGEAQFRARRFDADRQDEVVPFDEALAREASPRQLLWLDILGPVSGEDATRLGDAFSLDERTRQALESPADEPRLWLHGAYVHLTVAAEPNAERPRRAPWLSMIAADNVVITQHAEPIHLLERVDEQIEADSAFGLLDGESFLATLLDMVVTSYFESVDGIEDEVDRLDARSLRDAGQDELLDDLVRVRRRISELRRLLARHRSVYAGLVSTVHDHDDERRGETALAAVAERFTQAIGAVESSRDVVLGSFDVYMTRTAQRTNEVMKVLTLATVLLLPGSLIAGLLGMNVSVPLSNDSPWSFWIVVAGVVVLAGAITFAARRMRWL